jgi:hypothetical protein
MSSHCANGGALGRRRAADIEQQTGAADGKLIHHHLGLGGSERGFGVRCAARLATIAGGARRLKRVGGREHEGFGGEGVAGDLADGLLQDRVVRRALGRRVIKAILAGDLYHLRTDYPLKDDATGSATRFCPATQPASEMRKAGPETGPAG